MYACTDRQTDIIIKVSFRQGGEVVIEHKKKKRYTLEYQKYFWLEIWHWYLEWKCLWLLLLIWLKVGFINSDTDRLWLLNLKKQFLSVAQGKHFVCLLKGTFLPVCRESVTSGPWRAAGEMNLHNFTQRKSSLHTTTNTLWNVSSVQTLRKNMGHNVYKHTVMLWTKGWGLGFHSFL